MWKRLHRGRSTTLSQSTEVEVDGDGEQKRESDREEMAIVLPIDLNGIGIGESRQSQEVLSHSVGENGKARRPAGPRPLDLQNSVPPKQSRRRSLLGGLLPRLGGSPTGAVFVANTSSQSPGEPMPSSPPPPTSAPSNTPTRPHTPSQIRPPRSSTPHRESPANGSPIVKSSSPVATQFAFVPPTAHTPAPNRDTSRSPLSRSRSNSFSNNSLPMRMILTPTPPSISQPPPRRPRRSPKRPSTAPSPTSTSPSIFSSSSPLENEPPTPRSFGKRDPADYFINARPDWSRTNGLRSFPPSAVDDTELNRKSMASDLTTSTADTVTPPPRPSPYHAGDGSPSVPGASAPPNNASIQQESFRTRPGAWPPLTPFGARVTAVMQSLSPALPLPSTPQGLPKPRPKRAVTLPHSLVSPIRSESAPPLPPAEVSQGDAGVERKGIPPEWMGGAASLSVDPDGTRMVSTTGEASKLDNEDLVPLELDSSLTPEGTLKAVAGVVVGGGLSRKSASVSAGVITRSAAASGPGGMVMTMSAEGDDDVPMGVAGNDGLKLARSRTVAGDGALHRQGPDGGREASDPRQIAFERRERARNVWRARKMAQVFGSEPPVELLQSMSSISHSQTITHMLDTKSVLDVEVESVLEGDAERVNRDVVVGRESDREKEDGDQSPTSISSPPSSSGLHTPDSSLDLGSPVRTRFGEKMGSFSDFHRPSANDISEEGDEDNLRADFRIRRMRARKLERFFGVPAPNFQEQLPTATGRPSTNIKGPSAVDETLYTSTITRTPTPTPIKQSSMLSMATSTAIASDHSSTSDLLQRVKSRTSAESRRSPAGYPQPLQQHTPNSHSISTSTPSTQVKVTRTHGYSQSQSNIGFERSAKRWPHLTSMVKDNERERGKVEMHPVDENDAEQMKEVMTRLRKLR